MDKLFSWAFKKRDAAPTTSCPAKEKALVPGSGSFLPKIIKPMGADMALTVSSVYRAVELRAKTEAQFQPQYQKLNRSGGNFVQDMYGIGKRINYLLQVSPNPIMSAATFWEQMVISRLLTGNALAYIERDQWGDPYYIWVAMLGGYNPITNTYNLTYATDMGIFNRVDIPARDVLHLPNTYRAPEGYLGISTIRFMFDTLSLIKTESAQALDTAAKGGRMKLLVGEGANGNLAPIGNGLYDPETLDNYAKEIQSKLYTDDVVAIRAIDKVTNISMTAKDMQLLELINASQDDVSRYFGTPRPLLMLDTNSHYTTPTNATLEYMTRTIQPDILEIEQECTRKLLKESDFGMRRIHLCEQPLLRLDKEAQAKVDEINLRTGAKTVNEIRQQYDLPAVDDGDIVYVSTNLAELGSEKLSAVASGGRPSEDNTNQEGGEQ